MPIVPNELEVELRNCIGQTFVDDLSKTFRAAFLILCHYFGQEWVDRHIRLNRDACDFMLNNFDEMSDDRFVHMHRVIALADSIFGLQGCCGFERFIERASRRHAIRSSFFEAQIAAEVSDDGFEITIVRETGQRGSDFDLFLRRENVTIEAEVTEKDDGPITAQAVENKLRDKRNQVSGNSPAILYVVLPESWVVDAASTEAAVAEGVLTFFRGSRRFNAIVFKFTVMQELGGGRIFALAYRPYLHDNPRHLTDLSFLSQPALGDVAGLTAVTQTRAEELRAYLEADNRWLMPRFWSHYRSAG